MKKDSSSLSKSFSNKVSDSTIFDDDKFFNKKRIPLLRKIYLVERGSGDKGLKGLIIQTDKEVCFLNIKNH